MKNFLIYVSCCLVGITVVSQNVSAQSEEDKRIKHYNHEEKVGLEGYDPVAYFTQNKALKGNKSNSYTYKKITYYFSSQRNMEAFVKAPEKYEPAYGGWCAYAMGASGEKVTIDPETFKVVDGKLYLFYNQYFNNTLPKWNKDEVNLQMKADNNWRKLYQ